MSEAAQPISNLGLLARIGTDGQLLEFPLTEEQRARNYAVERLADVFYCPLESARAWLDYDDAQAIDAANMRIDSGGYVDFVGTFH